ncbi:MAG TPA: oligosaccharide flippase family protein [Acidimicrobiales bacterium]|nr:oligosaccharide flippase family protein [Acidimicrobiales bacterium]
MAAQILSSATNLGLSVVAGRLLGPSGLGVVSVGIAAYLLAQGLQRALVTDPLRVSIAGRGGEETRAVIHHGFTLALTGGLVATALGALLGVAVGGSFGRGLLLFAPWTTAALVQDFWRWALFGADRPQAATANDGMRAFFMVVTLPGAFWVGSDSAVVASWGVGAFAAATLGWFQIGSRPAGTASAWGWWRREALPLGRWLALESLVIVGGGTAVTFIVASVLGAEALGGLRAVDTVFAPMTLLGQALELPGLPYLSKLWRSSTRAARGAAARVSGIAFVLLTAYLAMAFSLRGTIMTAVFGSGFRQFERLIAPVAVSESIYAGGLGFFMLLKASGRGRARVVSEAVLDVTTICLVWALALRRDLLAVAWGRTIGAAAGQLTATVAAIGRRGPRQVPLTLRASKHRP